jgi:hypothetical protein
MAHTVLFMGSSHERGEIRLFNVACLRGVLRPARSKNLERTMPITLTLPGWMEVAVGSPALPANHLGIYERWRLNRRISEVARVRKQSRSARA